MRDDKANGLERLRVVYLSRGFGDYLSELMNAMADRNDVFYVCSRLDEPVAGLLREGVRVFRSGAPRVRSPWNLAFLRKIGRFLREVNPHIVHFQSGTIWELLLSPFFRGRPMVLTRHDVVPHARNRRGRPLVVRLASNRELRLAAGIIVHSERLAAQCRSAHERLVRGKPIEAIPLGALTRYGVGEAAVEARAKRVLFFGTVDLYKGLEHLAAAWGLVRQAVPGARLTVAGATRLPDYYRGLFCAYPEVECRFWFQSAAETRELFTSSDAIVLPYVEASQSAVLQIAFAFGLPAAVSRVGGLADVVKDQYNALAIEPSDTRQVAAAIIRLLTDAGLRARLIQNMVEERNTIYSWKSIAATTDQFYRRLRQTDEHPHAPADLPKQRFRPHGCGPRNRSGHSRGDPASD